MASSSPTTNPQPAATFVARVVTPSASTQDITKTFDIEVSVTEVTEDEEPPKSSVATRPCPLNPPMLRSDTLTSSCSSTGDDSSFSDQATGGEDVPTCLQFDEESFLLRPIKGKGLGLLASREIEPGETIMTELPFIQLQLTEDGDIEGKYDRSTGEFRSFHLDKQLYSKSDGDLERFYKLCDVYSDDMIRKHEGDTGECSRGKAKKKTNFGIIKTNSFSVGQSNKTWLMLFPGIARINHACQPNCHHYWTNRGGGRFVVRAVRHIRPGEEITLSYMSPLQRSDFSDRDARRSILQEEFGFFCVCDLCELRPEISRQVNDRKRSRVLEIEADWRDLGQNPTRALKLGEEQFRLCEELEFQAGLMSYVALHCVEALALIIGRCRPSDSNGYRAKCLGYAERAQFHGRVAYGEESEEAEIFKLVLNVCETSGDLELISDIQSAITSLRDIES